MEESARSPIGSVSPARRESSEKAEFIGAR
jgi:hypothetical protein